MLAFWMLLTAYRNMEINSDEQHAYFAHEFAKCAEGDVGIFEYLL